MPKAFSEHEREIIQSHLMEHGERLFSTLGLKKTSVEELARAAGISKAAFYLFFESKEALYLRVVERQEEHFRQQVLDAIHLPGPSPHARLAAVLKTAFRIWKVIPALQFFTRSEFELVARRMSPEMLAEHIAADRQFASDLIQQCRANGIPVTVAPEELGSLLYTLFFAVLHEDDLGPGTLTPGIDRLIELVAAYSLGQVSVNDEHDHTDRPSFQELRPGSGRS